MLEPLVYLSSEIWIILPPQEVLHLHLSRVALNLDTDLLESGQGPLENQFKSL